MDDIYYGDDAIYYAKWMISTGRCHDDADDVINHWNSYLLHTSYIANTFSSMDVAIFDVCIY